LLPYRDVFDNHGPIFHLLYSPLFRLLGERADIIVPMRLAVMPLWALSLGCVYILGKTLFSPRVGIWAVLLTAFYPEFLFTSTEFRTDDLWMTIWLVLLVIAVRGTLHWKRAFCVGLLLGAAFAVTVKTGLMVGSIGLAGALLVVWRMRWGIKADWPLILRLSAAAFAGLLVVPVILILFFTSHGALRDFIYCNVTHNLVPHGQNWGRLDAHLLWFPVFCLCAALLIAWHRPANWDRTTLQRAFVGLTAGAYFTALKSFFPTLSRQDDLPFIPLLVILVTAFVVWLPTRKVMRPAAVTVSQLALWCLVVMEILFAVRSVPFWRNDTKAEIANLADTLRASKPTEFVMDATGETIYRARPFYFALEAFTKVRMQRGMITDDIVERLIATQTAVVQPRDLTDRTQQFIRKNYIKINKNLSVAGSRVKLGGKANGKQVGQFDIVIPGDYVVVDESGAVIPGQLDGAPFDGRRTLAAGPHSLSWSRVAGGAPPTGRIAIIWASAFDRGIWPFK
jgi:hypothetical protein